MSKKKKKVRTPAKDKDVTSKSVNKPQRLSIIFLAVALLLFSVAIPLVQMRIDFFSSASEAYQFQALQVFFKDKYRQDQIALSKYLNILMEEKFTDQKSVRAISRMNEIIDERHKQYTVYALALALHNPLEKSANLKKIMEELKKLPFKELMRQYNEATGNKISAVTQKIANKLSFWKNIRIYCYAFAGFIFILGTVFQILSKRND
jgi:uncharacterized membrane protein YheB (UPF0754 family)